ncbi:MAG: hypothetical protein K0R84_2179 [Clostridia bacterium]|jgi:hypothetical protein|nr:hypothetical protein [Clostridia bacterium]
MSGGALAFMVLAWGTILGCATIFLGALLKHSKQ